MNLYLKFLRTLLVGFSMVQAGHGQDLISRTLPSPSPSPATQPMVEVAPTPSATRPPEFIPGSKELSASFSDAAGGLAKTTFSANTPNLYAQWRGKDLPDEAKIRCVWIAEDVGDVAEPNYTIDEAKAVATKPDAYGSFALSRPEDGWAPGAYRAEFYVNDKLTATVRIKITP